jgi:hypothetical protein
MDWEESPPEILDSMAGIGWVRYPGSGAPEQKIEFGEKERITIIAVITIS